MEEGDIEISVLSLKDLNKHGFNECIQFVKASNFSVPHGDGDSVFPMKKRYDKVRSDGVLGALELPQGSLENHDAEEQPELEGSDEPICRAHMHLALRQLPWWQGSNLVH